MSIFNDIKEFFGYLNTVDIIFLVSVVALLILVVTLIYFIKINKSNGSEDILNFSGFKEVEKDNNEILENDKDDINVNNNVDDEKKEDEYDDEECELLDLKELTKKLESERSEQKIKLTEYEKDQEEKAIISYDELLKKHNKYAINYEKEETFDDLVVKKVDLNDLENKNVEDNVDSVRVISYQKEEEFLKALKELNSLLN